MKLEPITFRPIVKTMLWGREVWEITCRPNEMGIIDNGAFSGMAFDEFITKDPAAVLGTDFAEAPSKLPLLVKFIEARDTLSVQVHPDDDYAAKKGGGDTGKSECWYIIEPPHDGHLIVGVGDLQGLNAHNLGGEIESRLNRLRVQRGDIVNIPAGLVHALTAGTVVAEIQQNSDITYRLYDFGRLDTEGKPRQLHIEDALAVIKNPKNGVFGDCLEHFSVEKHTLSEPKNFTANPRAFSVFVCVDGSASFKTAASDLQIAAPRAVFIPAGMGELAVVPRAEGVTVLEVIPAPAPAIRQAEPR
ncbi:MAG: class I mannose-6-phosphate isomerase [Defluviitaleaceae bacterium]|nr:class I mannose-6-phosphate isomerase [Defluviitaleaceae bacterium]